MIKTYITSTEANESFPQDSQFSAGQKSSALRDSFGLVNEYLPSVVSPPVVAPWDGVNDVIAPAILKVAQKHLYRYLLLFSNHGMTDEVRDLLEQAKEMLSEVRQSQLNISGAQIGILSAGWHVVEGKTNTNDAGAHQGEVFVRGAAPDYITNYKVTITSLLTKYPAASGGIEYKVEASYQSAAICEDQAGTYEWKAPENCGLEIRFDGQWTVDDVIYIRGIPDSEVNAITPKKTITQASIDY